MSSSAPWPAGNADRAALLDALAAVPDTSAAVADALDELGCGTSIGASVLAPLRPGTTVCGPAITLRYRRLPGDQAANRRDGLGARLGDRDLYATARPGDIAVFDCPGSPDAAVVGAISAHWARLAGVAACVVDGAIRDSVSIAGSGLPVWSAGRSARAARFRYTTESIGRPVRLAGHLVHPGDIVVADDDGVCVVPDAMLLDVVRICVEADRIERELLAVIRSSGSVAELLERMGDRPSTEFDR